jgi:rhodanese-related sulfurtransferase
LEFQADPELPSHNKALDKAKTVIVYCASGGRSALAGKTLKDLGYTQVLNGGGFAELAQGGVAIER